MIKPPQGIPEIEMTIAQHPLYADDPAIQWFKDEIQEYARAMMTMDERWALLINLLFGKFVADIAPNRDR